MADDLLERENKYVDDACGAACKARAAASPCAPVKYSLLFKTPNPSGTSRFKDAAKDMDYRCWSALPYLLLDKPPGDMVSAEEAKAKLVDECYTCREKARLRFKLDQAVRPDARLWIGVALAGAGLLLAVVKRMR